MSSREAANRTPSDDPCAAGFTTSGNPSCVSIPSSASAAPSSRNAVELNATQSGVGTPASRRRCFANTLSMQRMHAATRGPVYGTPRISSSSCGVPSSPPGPCKAMNATSGPRSLIVRTRPESASIGMTSCPSEARASSTRAADRSAPWRSSELPPVSTATRTRSLVLPRPAQRHDVPRGPRIDWLGEPVLGGDRLVELYLIAHHCADAPDSLADLVLARTRKVQPHRTGSPAAVHICRSAGDERDVLTQCLREQIGGVDVVREGRPDEERAARSRPGGLRGKVALQGLEHRVPPRAVHLAQTVDVGPPPAIGEVLE